MNNYSAQDQNASNSHNLTSSSPNQNRVTRIDTENGDTCVSICSSNRKNEKQYCNISELNGEIKQINSDVQQMRSDIENLLQYSGSIYEVQEQTESINNELDTVCEEFNAEIREIKARNDDQDRNINELISMISQMNSNIQLIRSETASLSQRITALEQLQVFSSLKDLLKAPPNSNTETCLAQLNSLKNLENSSLKSIEQSIDSFPENIKELFHQIKDELEDFAAQNRECDRLLAILRQRLIPDSLVSGKKLLQEKIPELFLALCKFAVRTNQRPLLDWLTSKGFEGFAAVGLKLINPNNGDNFDRNTCIAVSTVIAPSTGMRGKVAACLCPGLMLVTQNIDNLSLEYCYAPAEISLYT